MNRCFSAFGSVEKSGGRLGVLKHCLTEYNGWCAHVTAVLVSLPYFVLSQPQLSVAQDNYRVLGNFVLCAN